MMPKFTLKHIFGLVVGISVVLAFGILFRKLEESKREIARLRGELQRPVVGDKAELHIVRASDSASEFCWKIYLPPNESYVVGTATEGVHPIFMPNSGDDWVDLYDLPTSPEGQDITLRAWMKYDQQGDLYLVVAWDNMSIHTPLPRSYKEWFGDDVGVIRYSQPIDDATHTLEGEEPLTLLRILKEQDSERALRSPPGDGIAVWIAKKQISKTRLRRKWNLEEAHQVLSADEEEYPPEVVLTWFIEYCTRQGWPKTKLADALAGLDQEEIQQLRTCADEVLPKFDPEVTEYHQQDMIDFNGELEFDRDAMPISREFLEELSRLE